MTMQAGFLEMVEMDDIDAWRTTPVVEIGRAVAGVGEPVASVGIRAEDGRRWRVALHAGIGQSPFREVRCVGERVWIGYGGHVVVFAPGCEQLDSHPMDGYFGHLATVAELDAAEAENAVLAASASELLCFARDGRLAWRAGNLGLDGVVVHRIRDGVIEGDGEWDPPGGWRPFRLRLDSGVPPTRR